MGGNMYMHVFCNLPNFSVIIILFNFGLDGAMCRFERERTCPLCRALVKPADLRSFGDGSTSLFFQVF